MSKWSPTWADTTATRCCSASSDPGRPRIQWTAPAGGPIIEDMTIAEHHTEEVLRLADTPRRDTDTTPPVILNLNDGNSPADAMDVLSLTPFINGEQPW